LLVEAEGDEVRAELIDCGELDCVHTQCLCGFDIDQLVVEEEGFLWPDVQFFEDETVDGGVGLGHLVLEAPDQRIEVVNPEELALNVGEDVIAHVGEDGGEQTVLFELLLPGEHGGILRGPHAGVYVVEFVDCGGREIQAGIASEFLPESESGELAFVVGVAIGPVEGLKSVGGQAGGAEQVRMGLGVLLTRQDHSVVKDNRTQRQGFSFLKGAYGGKRRLFLFCLNGLRLVRPLSRKAIGVAAMRFSRRTGWNTEESDLARAHRLRVAAGLPIADLTASNPTRCGFEYDPALLEALSDPAALDYDPQPRGSLRGREAVRRYYADHGVAVRPEQIVLTTSTSEAYNYLFKLLCDPGTEIVAPQPGYPLFDFLAVLDDVGLRQAPLVYDHGWQIEPQGFRQAITERTRAIVLVHPNNPTGHFTKPWEADELARLCREFDLSLIVDEVFLDYALAGGEQSFAAGLEGVPVFVVSGLSKIAGLPQMKAAWIVAVGPEADVALERLEVIADTFLSMNAPVQCALPGWIAGRGGIQRQIQERVRANLVELDRQLERVATVSRLEVEGGWYATLRIPALKPDEETVLELLERGVWVQPGGFFGMGASGWLVLSLLTPETEFITGVTMLIDHLVTTQGSNITLRVDQVIPEVS